jgi:uncharacterized protein (DUF2147 family)
LKTINFKIAIIILFVTFNSSAIIAQNYADKIIGFYHVEDPFSEDESIVEIYKANNGEYEARTIKMRYPYDKDGNLRLDKKNPDPAKRTTACDNNTMVFYGFKYDKEGNKWIDGKVYNPNSGTTYKATINIKDENEIRLRGYVGIKALGMTMTWKRLANPEISPW